MPVVGLGVEDVADRVCFDEGPCVDEGRVPVQHEADEGLDPGLAHGVPELLDTGDVEGHRLLDDHVLACRGGLDALGHVQMIGRAQRQELNAVVGHQLIIVGVDSQRVGVQTRCGGRAAR